MPFLGVSIYATGDAFTYDADALAFFAAAGITNPVQKMAVNNLCLSLKACGAWPIMDAVYPFVGGTATSHKYNLKNPQNTDAAFRIIFAGGVTHNANGITGDGTSGYGDTKWNPNTRLSNPARGSYGWYARVQMAAGSSSSHGAVALPYRFLTFARYIGDLCIPSINDGNALTFANSDTRGTFITNRRANSSIDTTIRGTTTTINQVYTGSTNANMYLLCRNQGGPSSYSVQNLAFFFLAKQELTSSAMYTAVNAAIVTFQTTLGRNV